MKATGLTVTISVRYREGGQHGHAVVDFTGKIDALNAVLNVSHLLRLLQLELYMCSR